MKVSNLSTNATTQNGSSSSNIQPFVIVQPFPGGLEIMCSYSFNKCLFPLSRLLRMLLKEGLNLISCTSNMIEGRFIYTIRSEVLYLNSVIIQHAVLIMFIYNNGLE